MSLITVVLAIASVVGAIPTLESRDDYGIIDPWDTEAPPGQQGVGATIAQMLKRDVPSNVGGFTGQIPGCDVDPSFEKTKNTAYEPNQGVKVPKEGKDDQCTTGKNGDHCWTEYYLVEQAVEYTNWRMQGAGIDCASTSQCDSANAMLHQTCTSTGTTTTDGYDLKIIEGSLTAEFDLGLIKFTPGISGGGTTVTHSSTSSSLAQACVASTDTQTCRWTDQKCHQLWVADRVMHVWGHLQRVCIGPGRNVQQNTQRSNGNYIRGQHGFDFSMPINTLQGCGAECSATEYKASLPPNAERRPFPKPAGW